MASLRIIFFLLFACQFPISAFSQKIIKNPSPHVEINQDILKKYDIRGEYGTQIDEDQVYYIARAFASYLHNNYGVKKNIAVGYDGRTSSPALFQKLIQGLIDSGANVTSIGMCTTPQLSYFGMKNRLDAWMMITASHNPGSDNGIKISLSNGVPFYGNQIKKLGKISKNGKFIRSNTRYDLKVFDNTNQYIERILKDLEIKKQPINIVWDCGNGVAGLIVPELIKKIPGNHKMIFCDIDGSFPNHPADPSVEHNLTKLKDEVIAGKYDLGIAFDGDADRVGFVDSNGKFIKNDVILTIFAKDILSRNTGARIVMDVKMSRITMDEIRRSSGIPIMYKTGHSFIKNKMRETKALLAGESSGHFFFKEKYYGFDDGIYAAIRMINIISQEDSLSKMAGLIPEVFITDEIKIEADKRLAEKIIKKMQTSFKVKNLKVITIDGIRVEYKNGWWLVRSSNTQDILTLRCEGNNRTDMLNMLLEMNNSLIKSSDGKLNIDDYISQEMRKDSNKKDDL